MQTIFNWSQGSATKEVYRGGQRPGTPAGLRDAFWMLDFNTFHINPLGGDVFSYQFSIDGNVWSAAVSGVVAATDITLPENMIGIRITRTSGAGSSLGSVSTEVIPDPGPKLLYALNDVTDAGGNYSYVFSPSLAAIPILSVDILSATPGLTFSTLSKTVNGFTIQVRAPAIVSVLGINVLSGTFAAAAGIPISVLVAKA